MHAMSLIEGCCRSLLNILSLLMAWLSAFTTKLFLEASAAYGFISIRQVAAFKVVCSHRSTFSKCLFWRTETVAANSFAGGAWRAFTH